MQTSFIGLNLVIFSPRLELLDEYINLNYESDETCQCISASKYRRRRFASIGKKYSFLPVNILAIKHKNEIRGLT